MRDAAPVPDVVALDVETTGLYPHLGDRICEIALVKVRHGEIFQRLVTLVNPEREISFSAQVINGITSDMVAGAPTFREIAGAVVSFIRDETLLVHNARFDLGFLRIQLQACGLEMPEVRLVDTLYLARRFFRFASNSLPDLAKQLGLRQTRAHRAESDAITAYRLFRALYQRLREQDVPDSEIFTTSASVDAGVCVFEHLPPAIAEALEKRELVRLTSVEDDGRLSKQNVRPLELVNDSGIWYLVADSDGSDRVAVRLDRIVEVVRQFE